MNNHKCKKFFAAVQGVDMDARTVTAKISTQSLDRDGDVLISRGCNASEFLKNPTVFFNHDYDQPVGKNTNLQINDDHVMATTWFAERPDNHKGEWLPDKLLSLFDQQVIRGFSVGFQPVKSRKPTSADRKTFGQEIKQIFEQWKLLEYSIAPLPANADALALAVSKAVGCSVEMAKSLCCDTDADMLPDTQNKKTNDTQIVTQDYVEQVLLKHLQTVNETLSNAIKTAFDAEPGGMLHEKIYDIAEIVVQCVMAQGIDGTALQHKSCDDDHLNDDQEQVDPELEELAALIEQHKPTR